MEKAQIILQACTVRTSRQNEVMVSQMTNWGYLACFYRDPLMHDRQQLRCYLSCTSSDHASLWQLGTS